MTTYRIFTLVIVVCIGAVLIHLLRHRQIKEKYVWMWLALDVMALGGAIHPAWVHAVARMAGFQVTSNMVFFGVILLLVVLSIHLAMVVTRLEEDRRTLTEQVAMLRHDLDALEARTDAFEARIEDRNNPQ